MQKMENRPEEMKRRLYYLDVLRAVACLSVVMIHVSAEFVIRGNKGADFWLGNLFDSLSRAGVPLFVMISGALMLDENYTFTVKKWLGHIGRMSIFYMFWSDICGWIGSPDYHLWFVPMIVGVYLLVPMLRLWVNEQNIRWVEGFLIVSLVFAFIIPQIVGIVPGTGFLQPIMDNFALGFAPGYTAYFVLGWYLNRSAWGKKLACVLGVCGFAITFAGTAFASVCLKMKSYPFYENFTINVLMYSAAIFIFCRCRFERPKKADGTMKKIICGLAKHSLGLYAVHLYVISRLLPHFGSMHVAVAAPLIFVLTAVISGILSLIFRQIPLLKKIV